MVTLNGSSSPKHRLSPDPAFQFPSTGENRGNPVSGRNFERQSNGVFPVKPTCFSSKPPTFKPVFSKWIPQTALLAVLSANSPMISAASRGMRGSGGVEPAAQARHIMIPSSFESKPAPVDRNDSPPTRSTSSHNEAYIATLSLKSDDSTEEAKSPQSQHGDAVCQTNVPTKPCLFDKPECFHEISDTHKIETRADRAELAGPQSEIQPAKVSECESASFFYHSEDVEPKNVPQNTLDSISHILGANISSSVSVGENEVRHVKQDASQNTSHGNLSDVWAEDRPSAFPHGATEVDAKRYGIPAGYSLKYWNPEEEPIVLLRCVFDAASLGGCIHRWTVQHYGKMTPIAGMAEELHRLLLELSTKLKLAADSVTCVAGVDDSSMLKDFLDAGNRLTDRLYSLLEHCESPILKAAKVRRSVHMIEESGAALVQAIFGHDQELDRTEQLMASIRLWSFRFDVNCQDILRSIQSTSKSVPVSGFENSEDPLSQIDHFKSSPLLERENLSSAESMDDDITEVTTSDLSYMSDDFGEADLGDGHSFLDELPGLIELVLEKLEMWCADRRREGSSESPEARNPGNSTEPSPEQRPPKRDRASDNGTGFGDDGRLSTTRQGKKTKRDDSEKRLLLACPFYKKDKLRHKGCLRYQLVRIKDVKQHLCRRHMQPQFCPLCGLEFESQSEQREHIRTQLCMRREIDEPEGITEDQKKALSTRVGRTMTLEQQWYAVWDVVFPDIERPSSVYVQSEIVETLCNFQEFFSQHGQTLIAERLRSRELPYNMPNEERDLAALLAMTAAEAVDTLIERYTSSIVASASDEEDTTPPTLVDDESATQNGPGSIDQHTQHLVPKDMPELLPLSVSGNASKDQAWEYDESVGNQGPPEHDLAWTRTEDLNLGFDTYLDLITLGTINE